MSAVETKPEMSCAWLADHKRGWQLGEQGILEAIIKEIEGDIPEEHRWCVEFGAGDGARLPLTCDQIIRRPGWRALLIEGDKANSDTLKKNVPPFAVVVNGMVLLDDGSTIDDHMEAATCPSSPALMVVDVDSIDYYIVTQMKARPYVLCVEHLDLLSTQYNSEPFVPQVYEAGSLFTCPGIVGKFHLNANSMAFDISVPQMGYTLVARTRLNSIYARNDVVSKIAKVPDGKLRLNIGAGRFNDPRYTKVDIEDGIDARKLPYETGTVDEIYASHVLEHFSFYETKDILAEWSRVLKPGGIMKIAVPDAVKVAKQIAKLDAAGDTASVRELAMVVYGAHTDPTNIHHNHFTEATLREALNAAGIGFVKRFDAFIPDDCANLPISLNLMGTKRGWARVENPVVTCILSQPRFTFTGHEMRMVELARRADFNIQPCMGAFWERDMNAAIEDAIAKTNPDFLFFSDYDSVFEVDDYMMLLDAIQSDPEMAAIGSVQMSRHSDLPLVFEAHRDYTGDVCRVDFQHFGLTIIRREAIDEARATLDGPLLYSIPGKDANGKWDWNEWTRSDGDITFWRNLKSLGFKVCQHNKVCIGHIVQCVKYPRDKGRGVQLIPIENYWKYGKPKDAKFNPAMYSPAAAAKDAMEKASETESKAALPEGEAT